MADRVRTRLDDWRFWVGVAYFGLAVVVLGLYVLFNRQTSETAKRVAIQRAAAQAQVSSCADGVKNAPVVAGFVEGQHAIISNSILSTTAALQAERVGDPLHDVREASLRRLELALANSNALREIVAGTTPSRQSCNNLADGLGVPRPFPT